MTSNRRLTLFATCPFSLFLCFVNVASGVTSASNAKIEHGSDRALLETSGITPGSSASESAAMDYKWNVDDRELPLLGLTNDRLQPGIDRSLSYPMDRFSFPIFKALTYDDEHGKYLLPAVSKESERVHFIEFERTAEKNVYTSVDGTNLELTDRDSLKTINTNDGSKYFFVRYPDGEFRCAGIKHASGVYLNLLYMANGLMLHGVVDSSGRTITFNYTSDGIESLTQTWMANSTGLTKTWPIGDQKATPVKYSHAGGATGSKLVPTNAVTLEYTSQMAASDKMLAQTFGGPKAVAAANGFEPAGLAAAYPLYRGDVIGDDGKLRRGHLSRAMHLYGSTDGKSESPLYVPAGFTSYSGEPSPTDAVVTFYYPRLGVLSDVTLAVFHVADFQISYEGERVRIGNIGGPGGSSPFYKHSHIEFYKGKTLLPPAAARPALRIDPSTVFAASR